MADMRQLHEQLDEIEATLWWIAYKRGVDLPPPPFESPLGLPTTTAVNLIGRDSSFQPDEFD